MNIEELEGYITKHTEDHILNDALNFFFGTSDNAIDAKVKRFNDEEFNEITESITYFQDSITDIKQNWKQYRWLYDLLPDEKSRETLLGMVEAKLSMNTKYIENVFASDNIYFDEKIFGKYGNETYVDCGAYTGDSILRFVQACPHYNKIYAFEAVPEIALKCQKTIESIDIENRISLMESAVFSRECELTFDLRNANGDSKISDDGQFHVKAVSLDTVINTGVTFIKMDIEGSESEALEGAKRLIKEYSPKMAICIYHLVGDYWKIPRLILSMNPNYSFKIRQHDPEVYSETVLYCIPPQADVPCEASYYRDISRTLLSCNKKLHFYTADENENLLQHVKDKKWFIRQLRNYRHQVKLQDEELRALKKYRNELVTAKTFLEQQMKNYQESCAQKEQVITELRQWSSELETAKAYLEDQVQNYRINSEHQEQVITELRQWTGELEEGKAYLESKFQTEKKVNAALISKNQEISNSLDEAVNTISKMRYKLRLLTEDAGVQKIIKKKKYEI